jgi:hypothetical protein
MMRACDLFDKYRDGELGDSERNAFASHLVTCEGCRTRMALLDNLVSVLRQEVIQTSDLAERIARKAFQKASSWDALVASWFQPKFAMAAAGLVLTLFSFLWLLPANRSIASYTEYEILLNQADASNLAGNLLVKNDNELVLQFMQGEISSERSYARSYCFSCSLCFWLLFRRNRILRLVCKIFKISDRCNGKWSSSASWTSAIA